MKARRAMLTMSWIVIVLFPLVLAGLAFSNNWDISIVAAVLVVVILLLKIVWNFGS